MKLTLTGAKVRMYDAVVPVPGKLNDVQCSHCNIHPGLHERGIVIGTKDAIGFPGVMYLVWFGEGDNPSLAWQENDEGDWYMHTCAKCFDLDSKCLMGVET